MHRHAETCVQTYVLSVLELCCWQNPNDLFAQMFGDMAGGGGSFMFQVPRARPSVSLRLGPGGSGGGGGGGESVLQLCALWWRMAFGLWWPMAFGLWWLITFGLWWPMVAYGLWPVVAYGLWPMVAYGLWPMVAYGGLWWPIAFGLWWRMAFGLWWPMAAAAGSFMFQGLCAVCHSMDFVDYGAVASMGRDGMAYRVLPPRCLAFHHVTCVGSVTYMA